MLKNLKYAIMALVFIGIVKILQVSIFDKSKYTKLRKAPYISSAEKKQAASKTDKAEEIPLESTFKEEQETPPPVLERSTKDPKPEAKQPKEEKKAAKDPQGSVSFTDLKNGYLAPILAKLPAGQLREDITVRYYRHEEDGDGVYALKNLGYYIHEKEVAETAGLGSNVLYYGSDVSTEDIRIIAYTLVENGIQLKSIAPTQYGWKSTSVEVGTNPELVDSSIMVSKADALNFSK